MCSRTFPVKNQTMNRLRRENGCTDYKIPAVHPGLASGKPLPGRAPRTTVQPVPGTGSCQVMCCVELHANEELRFRQHPRIGSSHCVSRDLHRPSFSMPMTWTCHSHGSLPRGLTCLSCMFSACIACFASTVWALVFVSRFRLTCLPHIVCLVARPKACLKCIASHAMPHTLVSHVLDSHVFVSRVLVMLAIPVVAVPVCFMHECCRLTC